MNRILLFLLFIPFVSHSQDSGKSCDVLIKINKLIQHEHFNPKPVDDSLSVYVFETLMNELDTDKNIFLKTEYDYLSKYKFKFDDYIAGNDCSFFEDFSKTYKKALERSKTAIEKLQKEKLDYNTNDTVRFTKKNFPFYVKAEDVSKVFAKRLRFDILEDIAKTSKNYDSLKQNFASLEKKSREKIFETALCKITNRLDSKEGIEKNIRNSFYSIFCSYFDPHTSYFSYDTKSSFLSELSTDNFSLGMYVSLNENEELIVQEIVPGGPAARTEIIEKGDQVIKVSPKKGEDFLVSCSSLETIGSIIFSDTHKEITLSMRKKNGTLYDVTLQKKIMKADDHAAYSYIVSKNNTRIGYINIPSFYTDFDRNTVQGISDDVAKEILKLKKDNIEGLILDLQDDGGGSMEEAIKLSGMFIDAGPISVLVNNKKEQKIIKDFNLGVVYNGPIVVLVNGNSASASEFFASVMQDYNRAIIIGATTLGKASMQQILPIENGNEQDFVKLTIEKFYRITGKSHQLTGVVPDVAIPTLYDGIISREKSSKTALKNDVITTKAKFIPYSRSDFENLIAQSKKRVSNNAYFNEINAINTKINSIYNSPKDPILLNFESVFKDVHSIDAFFDSVKKIVETPIDFEIANTSYEKEILKFDEFQKSISEYRIKDLKTNAYVLEGINIISDYYATKKN
ncbi:S41 family peptidase [Flavobacterium lindanitolerans]|uniref:S41 family peptidase n=1 Tax=Flavobacterium lindanitolerans TaxID=428988 RepID=UPI00280753A0|nr:S41 family peptidase [Flavobacterium lindanitolerans]MDQ7960929.1 S41 family peptidase [Flavobacterium lindanitolerans]